LSKNFKNLHLMMAQLHLSFQVLTPYIHLRMVLLHSLYLLLVLAIKTYSKLAMAYFYSLYQNV